MLTLEADGVVLRDFVEEDFEAFYGTTQDPEYQRFYSEAEMTRPFWWEIFERILAAAGEAERQSFQMAMCLPSGEVIGTCGVRTEDAVHRQASFGCAIGRPYWGQGLAYAASRRILDHGFATLPIHRVYAETISENVGARALAERLGMRLEGELRENRYFHDRWWNTVIYSILREEWAAAAQ